MAESVGRWLGGPFAAESPKVDELAPPDIGNDVYVRGLMVTENQRTDFHCPRLDPLLQPFWHPGVDMGTCFRCAEQNFAGWLHAAGMESCDIAYSEACVY